MSDPIHVLAISGSLRKSSFNSALVRAAIELAPAGMTIEVADIRHVPNYDEDVRVQAYPAPVQKLREQIEKADALLIATPEYNFSIPGLLKNAIDWASRPPHGFGGKPLAIMGASGGNLGTARAQYHLRQVAVFLDMHPVNKPEVFVGRAMEKIDEQGNLHDEATRKMIAQLLESLATWTRKLRGR